MKSTLYPNILYLAAAVLSVWGVFVQNGGLRTVNEGLARGEYPDAAPGVTSFSRLKPIDDALMSLVAFNIPVLQQGFILGRLFMAHFVANVSVLIFILFVEQQRGQKPSTFAAMLWTQVSQIATSAVALPTYLLYRGTSTGFFGPLARGAVTVHPEDAACALLSHIIGFGLPAVMMFDPFEQGPLPKSLWILSFALSPIAIFTSNKILQRITRLCSSDVGNTPAKATHTMQSGYSAVQMSYLVVGGVSAFAHAATLLYASKQQDGLLFELFALDLRPNTLRGQILTFLKIDYLITFSALLTWAWNELVQVCRMASLRASLTIVAATLVFGPGAATAIVWSMREKALYDGQYKKK